MYFFSKSFTFWNVCRGAGSTRDIFDGGLWHLQCVAVTELHCDVDVEPSLKLWEKMIWRFSESKFYGKLHAYIRFPYSICLCMAKSSSLFRTFWLIDFPLDPLRRWGLGVNCGVSSFLRCSSPWPLAWLLALAYRSDCTTSVDEQIIRFYDFKFQSFTFFFPYSKFKNVFFCCWTYQWSDRVYVKLTLLKRWALIVSWSMPTQKPAARPCESLKSEIICS